MAKSKKKKTTKKIQQSAIKSRTSRNSKLRRLKSIGNFILKRHGWKRVYVRYFDKSDIKRTAAQYGWSDERAHSFHMHHDYATVSSLDGVTMNVSITPKTTTFTFLHELAHLIFDTDSERAANRHAARLMKTDYRSWLCKNKKTTKKMTRGKGLKRRGR